MRAEEIRAISPAEQAKALEEAHKELFNLRFRLATRQLVNFQEIRKVKKKIARLKTIMRAREIEAKHGS